MFKHASPRTWPTPRSSCSDAASSTGRRSRHRGVVRGSAPGTLRDAGPSLLAGRDWERALEYLLKPPRSHAGVRSAPGAGALRERLEPPAASAIACPSPRSRPSSVPARSVPLRWGLRSVPRGGRGARAPGRRVEIACLKPTRCPSSPRPRSGWRTFRRRFTSPGSDRDSGGARGHETVCRGAARPQLRARRQRQARRVRAGFTRVLEIVRAQGDRSREALALHNLATQRSWQGQYSDSLELSREGYVSDERSFVIAPAESLDAGLALTDTGTTTRRCGPDRGPRPRRKDRR
jgi:hypothetical protein